MHRRLVILALTLATASAHAADAVPNDVVVFCEPTLQPALAAIGASWRHETGVPVHVLTAPTALLLEQLSHHIRSDLVIAQGEAASGAALQRQLIKPETRIDLWRNHLVVARLASAPPVDLTTLAGTDRIAIVDAPLDPAGVETAQALAAAGFDDAGKAREIGVVGTADAAFLLAAGTAKLAVIYATDLHAQPKFSAAGTLADQSYAPVAYWAAETSDAVSPQAEKFLAFLRQPAAGQQARLAGLEVLP